MSQFDQDIALTPAGPGLFAVTISDAWNVNVGPNGGYIAAILLHGLKTALGATGLQTRSVTYHFLSASVPGPATLAVNIEKRGRTLSTLVGKLTQGERTIAISIATFAPARDFFGFSDLQPPTVQAADQIGPDRHMSSSMAGHVPFRDQYDQRLAIGPVPPASGQEGRVGGWTRFRDRRMFDDLAVVAISDSWYPSVLARSLPERIHAPTVDHTVHFMTSLPLAGSGADDFLLVEFSTEVASEGYLLEDGRIWSRDGVLIATSRQLAFMMAYD